MLARIRPHHSGRLLLATVAESDLDTFRDENPGVTFEDFRDAEIGYQDRIIADQRRQIRDLDFHLDKERRRNKLLYGVIVALMVLTAFLGGAYSRVRGELAEIRSARLYWEATR